MTIKEAIARLESLQSLYKDGENTKIFMEIIGPLEINCAAQSLRIPTDDEHSKIIRIIEETQYPTNVSGIIRAVLAP